MTRIDKALNMVEPDWNELKDDKDWQSIHNHWAGLHQSEQDWMGSEKDDKALNMIEPDRNELKRVKRIQKNNKDWRSIKHDWTESKRIEKG